jgi:hypothetical protein
MPKLRAILAAFSLVIFTVVVAHAQGTGAGNGMGIGAVGGVIGSFISSGISGTPGQPFSADVIEESDRFLADGNHIHRETHGRIFRDSQGRTRNETEMGNLASGAKLFVHIIISDPVEGRFILLNPEQKTATINQFGKRISAVPGLGVPAQSANNAAKPDAPAATAAEPGVLVQSLRDMRSASGTQAGGKLQISHEDLGATEIEGFTVTGTRYTRTIPAGERGNDQPMTTTNERWFSSDLKMDLLTKSESPEAGKHVRRLVNIRMGDPDPLLFQVPADYTVKETPQQQ